MMAANLFHLHNQKGGRMLKNTLAAALLLSLTACGTIFTGTSDNITVASNPPGTKVLMDGLDMGSTPVTFTAKRKITAPTLMLRKEGYRDRTIQMQNEVNIVALLDILFWPSFIVDGVTGGLMKYSNTTYNIDMDKATH